MSGEEGSASARGVTGPGDGEGKVGAATEADGIELVACAPGAHGLLG